MFQLAIHRTRQRIYAGVHVAY